MSRPPFWRVPRNRREEEEEALMAVASHLRNNGLMDSKFSHEQAIIMKKSGDAIHAQTDEQSTPNPTSQKSNIQSATLPRKVAEAADEHREKEVALSHQPYRTTPLILPGAKVRRESLPTQSFLQLQSNSMLWSSSSGPSGPTPVLGIHHQPAYSAVFVKPKEKVFDPMKGWRLDAQQMEAASNEAEGDSKGEQKENIEQSSVNQKFYNPRESETFRALMETETGTPAKPREVKNTPQKVHTAPNAPFKQVNLMGLPQEKIQQSYSFRRLMQDLGADSDI